MRERERERKTNKKYYVLCARPPAATFLSLSVAKKRKKKRERREREEKRREKREDHARARALETLFLLLYAKCARARPL